MRIIFFGTPHEVVPVLENLIRHYDVVAVVTTPDQKSGRKQLLTPSPVKVFAQQHKIPVLQPEKWQIANGKLQMAQADLYVVAAFGKLIPNEMLKLPKHGAINIHPSLLPKYRGPTPIQTAILNGDTTSGISIIKMDEQMDHGAILHQIPFTLKKTDTFGWLMQSTFKQTAEILPHVIEEYVSGNVQPVPQDDSQATYTKRVNKQDGYINLDKMANGKWQMANERKIRAYYPWPTLWTRVPLGGGRMPARQMGGDSSEVSGTGKQKVIKFLPENNIQMEGKKPVSLKDFLNGYPELRDKIARIVL